MAVLAERRLEIVAENRTHPTDTGSPEVQVAMITERIRDIAEHLKIHDHDFHSRRGLVLMVGKRNRLLKYLAKTDPQRYQTLIARLGLRK